MTAEQTRKAALAKSLEAQAIAKRENAKHTPGPLPVNPYENQGSLTEAWQRGFDGRPMLAYPGSNYAKAYAEGQSARAAIAKATGDTP